MAWTQADADALKAAIAKGEKVVSYSDRSVTYRSLDEMIKALAMVEAEIASATSPSRPRQWLGMSGEGL